MTSDKKYEERRELIEIFNKLSMPLKKQLLTIARVIDTTQEITLTEKTRRKTNKV